MTGNQFCKVKLVIRGGNASDGEGENVSGTDL